MKRSRRPSVPLRRRVFLGCEGSRERAYGVQLRHLLEERCRIEKRGQNVDLDVVLLKPGGGDPLAPVERTLRQIADSVRKGERPYAVVALLLDADKLGQAPDRDTQMRKLAAAEKLKLIWQDPCHEALLLRHLDGCRNLRPPTTQEAMLQLERRWPEYTKGMPALQLGQRIDSRAVSQALQVEPDLAAFLGDIGLG
jgi:hypothetical protein